MKITIEQYDKLIEKAKTISRYNYMDIAHDAIVNCKDYDEAVKNLLRGKFLYHVSAQIDVSRYYQFENCKWCNEIKPANAFRRIFFGNRIYLGRVCKKCLSEYVQNWKAAHAKKVRAANRKYYHERGGKEKQKIYYLHNRDYILKRKKSSEASQKSSKEWAQKNKEYRKKYMKQWRQKKAEHIKKYNEKNKERINKYYRDKRKLQKAA